MEIVSDFDLSQSNTFGLVSRARYGAIVASVDDLAELAAFAKSRALPLKIIGGGSNIILRERIEGVVGLMAFKGRKVDGQIITAQAGEDWPPFVEWTVSLGLGGLENLAGIPGTVGAAPVQNIGAYGLELADRFHSLQAYDLETSDVVTLHRDDCQFAYRQSAFKQTDRYIILSVTLELPSPWQPIVNYSGLDTLEGELTPEIIMNRVLALRGSKLPDWRTLGNAGSFFHNPIVETDFAESIEGAPRYPQADGTAKLSAAWLIQSCGLKGIREGNAGVFENHALILVNHGGATYGDVAALTERIKGEVKDRFGITLTQEPLIM